MYLQYACTTKANWADLLTLKIYHSEKNGTKTILSPMFSLCVNASLSRSNLFFFSFNFC